MDQACMPAGIGFSYYAGFNQTVWDFTDLALKARLVKALENGSARYPILRELRFAARTDLEALFDDIALNLGWNAHRLATGTMILDGEGLFIVCHGGLKADYCSCFFNIWASGTERAEEAREAILTRVSGTMINEPMFSIDWQFLTSKGELESASIEELADDVLLDTAYPELSTGINDFIDDYLDAPETVLVVQGPPGTGKTRLIRAILGRLSLRLGRKTHVLYTGDMKALETDEIFVKFITGWHDAFVIEDADHLLKPRALGNENLHRFLAIADGVVRAQGRKIIFSTNLPNIGDLDDALIRPGRCFSRIHARELSTDEARRLLDDLCVNKTNKADNVMQTIATAGRRSFSLAEIYKAVNKF